jgi:MFS family permease
LPYGFQASALGAYLRSEGVSLTRIGLAGALAAPWFLKVLWAPLVDRFGSRRFGRRRTWIVPMQVLLAATFVGAALISPREELPKLLGLVLLMNVLAATMDIAVDALAVDVLRRHELGRGNAVQVVGYKVGMLLGGGLLVWASRWIGWSGLFVTMAALTLTVAAITLATPEPRMPHADPDVERDPASPIPRTSLRTIFRHLHDVLFTRESAQTALVVATYKSGESLIDPMFAPFLVDQGFAREDIGLWVGTFGMGSSIAGSAAGGLLATRWSLERALLLAGTLRCLPLVAQLALAGWGVPGPAVVVMVTIAEHFFGGALTTVLFAFMMSRVDRRIGATHFAFLATIEMAGKAPFALSSGALAERFGYTGLFAAGFAISVLWAVLLARGPLGQNHREAKAAS